ncbi:MAG: nucleotidyltransferase domain-containing protein [Nitrospirae bacterium]|nr:nucleotidyltransferase domain-containing protein [Nitrospirota bacterium]
MIASDVVSLIQNKLMDIEQFSHVRILYACESGSRAWGFASKDSDYDVRFIYVHPKDWYLSIEERRDVIERGIDQGIDISGWDVKKALGLFRKSNPPLLEWLNSPIIYRDRSDFANKLRRLIAEYYSPTACLHHYLHMAQGNHREYLKGPTVWLKKYFYVLRPLLACRWINENRGVAPIEFGILVEHMVKDEAVKKEIALLLDQKMSGKELDRGPKISPLSDFIERELEELSQQLSASRAPTVDTRKLDELFRMMLDAPWTN